jgi:hypothetical protein
MQVFVPRKSIDAGVCPAIVNYTADRHDRTSSDATVVADVTIG